MRSTQAFLIVPLFVALSSGAAILRGAGANAGARRNDPDHDHGGDDRAGRAAAAASRNHPGAAIPARLLATRPLGRSGNTWSREAGLYVQRPQAQSVWIPGHWLQEANGWTWIDGYWLLLERDRFKLGPLRSSPSRKPGPRTAGTSLAPAPAFAGATRTSDSI